MTIQSYSNKVKELRQRKAWSQSHLADAAGLNTRTVQRLEQTGHCSYETLLSIAAAFDIDIYELTDGCGHPYTPALSKESQKVTGTLWKEIDPRSAFIMGILFLIPSLLFILINVLKHELGLSGLYDFIVSIGEFTRLNIFAVFFISPVFLLGSALLAFILSFIAQVRIKVEKSEWGFKIAGLFVSLHIPCSIILVGSVAGLSILVGYAIIEELGHWKSIVLEILAG